MSKPISTVEFIQWQFFDQWNSLRKYAADRGVKFLGDIPIFVAMDSADVWANRRLNTPGEAQGNWQWRMLGEELNGTKFN